MDAALGAERVTFTYGAIERSISVDSLRTYATDGTIESDLRAYTRYLNTEQQLQLRQILQAQAEVRPVAVAQFLYTDQGEALLNRLGQVIRTEANLSGFYALRGSLILAARKPEGLTMINVLEEFPFTSLKVDLDRTFRILGELENLVRQTQQAVRLVEQQAALEAQAGQWLNAAALPDLRSPGPLSWDERVVVNNDSRRRRSFVADVYLPRLPQVEGTRAPLVVISHGLGSDRTTYAYLAQHLASYGFAVAVPEHPGSSSSLLQALLVGAASQLSEPEEFINRPLDIKFLLDNLEYLDRTDASFQGRIDTQQVGIIGQSFGGYTALALVGAKVNFEQLDTDCTQEDTLNLSLLLQCRAEDLPRSLPNLYDERIKAAVAINPIGGSLLGQESFAEIRTPVLIVSGSADTVAPALLEQLRPFTWLRVRDKYLVMLDRGTHFSTLDEPTPEALNSGAAIPLPPEIVGPAPEVARTYLKAIGPAFFDTYLRGDTNSRAYLESIYIQSISQPQLPISIVQGLTAAQLAKVFRDEPVDPTPIDLDDWTGSRVP